MKSKNNKHTVVAFTYAIILVVSCTTFQVAYWAGSQAGRSV